MAIRNWKDIPLFKDVTEEQWNDWHWQVNNRLSTLEDICAVVNLTEQEKEDIFFLHKYSQHKHHPTRVLPWHFFSIWRCFLYVSGDRKLISYLQRFQSSKHFI